MIDSSSDCSKSSYRCFPSSVLREVVLRISRWNAGTHLRAEAPQTPVPWGHQILASERGFGGPSVSCLFPSGTLSSGLVGKEMFSRSSSVRCNKAEWLLLLEVLTPLFLRLFRFPWSKVRRPAESYIWRQWSRWNPISQKPHRALDILWAIVFLGGALRDQDQSESL